MSGSTVENRKPTPEARQTLTVALVGNPNTGKTTLFNALSGLRQRVGNYPGVTVETKKGQMTCRGRVFNLVDLPGTYSLAPRSPDEMVAVDLLLGQQAGEARPDVVIALVDASNLERNLYLTTQVLELGVPVVIALNMVDVAEGQGIRIDAERLERQFSVPVVPIQANKGKGLDRLKEVLAGSVDSGNGSPVSSQYSVLRTPYSVPSTSRVPFPDAFEKEVHDLHVALGDGVAAFLVRRLLLDVGGYTEERLAQRRGTSVREQVQEARRRLAAAGSAVPGVEARARYAWIRQATAGCVQRPDRRPVTWTDRIDRVLTHRVWGTLVFLVLMFAVFEAIFLVADPVKAVLDVAQGLLADGVRGLIGPGALTDLLADGVIGGVGSVLVFLPQIAILFGFIAVLEDCGYMARAAFLMDRLMARCGLSGKSFIPLLSSVACAVPGILATRVIENRRDRLATILVAPLMSCSARLPVYILLIGAFLTTGFSWWVPGLTMFTMYALGLMLAPLVALLLKRTLLRGETPVFVMELPLYKRPSLRTVLGRMWDAGWAFVRRAGTLILASMVLVWALLYFPRTEPDGSTYDAHHARLKAEADDLRARAQSADGEAQAKLQKELKAKEREGAKLKSAWKRQSWLGRMGHAVEPAVRPLGWDWRIGMAVLASFPAREVVVGTLGIIYLGEDVDPGEIRHARNAGETELGKALRAARWEDSGRPVFTLPVALSVMVFFALCCQCASTLAVIRRETRSWRWPAFTFVYMTALAYLGALVVFQVGRLVA
jgi:ferrous iron transport protein B